MAEGEQPQGVQLSEIRANVEGVQEKMQNNVAMMVDRGEQLNNLDDKSQELKKNLANKIFGYLARCEFWLKLRW